MSMREERVRLVLEEMSRPMLYALARAIKADIRASTHRRELIEALAEMALPVLRRALADGVHAVDLRRLCTRFGYAATGSTSKLAGRLIAAIEEPTARIGRWRSFEQARSFARGLEFASQKQWFELARGRLPTKAKLPDDVPTNPASAYANKGWTDWGDFLGTGTVAYHLIARRPFAKARAYARSLGLANVKQWVELCGKRIGNRRVLPPDIPAVPDRAYANAGWVSWGDWLGTGHVHASKIRYHSYARARAFVRGLGIRTEPEWRAYCRGEIHRRSPRPIDIPSNPHRTYRDRGWVSWGEFLGTGSVAVYDREFRAYAEARAYIQNVGIADSRQWRAWCASGKRPADIPASPDRVYRGKGWTSWGEFFGTGNVHRGRIHYCSLSDAQAFVRALGLQNKSDYERAWHEGKIPTDIPLTIDRTPGWKSWASFLGT